MFTSFSSDFGVEVLFQLVSLVTILIVPNLINQLTYLEKA